MPKSQRQEIVVKVEEKLGLTRTEIDLLLSRNSLARVVFASADGVDIEPLRYAYEDGWLYGYTAGGRALEMSEAGWWPVALEVEELQDSRSWSSVVVHGGFYTLDPNGSPWERAEAEKAHGLLRDVGIEPSDSSCKGCGALLRVRVQEVTSRTGLPVVFRPDQ